MTAQRHAENASIEVKNLTNDLQTLLDAHSRGVPIRMADLEHLRAQLGFVRYHVARTQHAIAHGEERRSEFKGEAIHV